jgi:hypothetical protein
VRRESARKLGALLALPALGLAFVVLSGCGSNARKASLGASEGVDLYLRDSVDGSAEHWRSPDVKLDAPPYAEAPTTAEEFDRLRDEATVPDATNRAYVLIRNRGTDAAEDVRVTLYAGPATTMLPRLDGQPEGWVQLDPVKIDRIEAGGDSIVGFDLPRVAGHQCLVVTAGAPGDPAPALDEPGDRAVVASGNVTARNMDLTGGRFEDVLVVQNPTPTMGRATLEVRAPDGVRVWLGGIDSPVELEPGERRRLSVSVSSETAAAADVTVSESLESSEGEALRGGMTYLLRP